MRGGGTLVPCCTLLPVYTSVPCPSFIPWLSAVTSQEGGRNLRLLKPIGERQRDRSRPPPANGGALRGEHCYRGRKGRPSLHQKRSKVGIFVGILVANPCPQVELNGRYKKLFGGIQAKDPKSGTPSIYAASSVKAQPKKEGRRKAPSAPPESTGRQTTTC